ncbi:YfhO family protein [Cryptosporangium arvum]|uniref:Membrane protein YfhO n=1 Tax=Cryptosporangium arvum DSM 44712 TaxID=927661 RepID=A0A010YMH7_9ACTN|nr:YfhO family protein [Cryptosporangium arvum]EXG81430.1 membrane protein YfhO [Cryptosporangium arvum DSM 44712]
MSATQQLTPRASESPAEEKSPRWWRRRPDPLVTIVVLAIAAFALGGIGSPLWGGSSLTETGLLARVAPYTDGELLGVQRETLDLGDTVDSAIPNAALFGDAIRSGEWANWNPYALGGGSLGGTPNAGMASPVALPFWFLPAWLASAYMLLLQIVVAVGGSYLFLRRLKLGKPAALLGGLAFATSAFMIVWVNWPQSRVAAFVPAVFWALECVVQNRRPRDAALLALTCAAMWLGGFPAVTMYALVTGAFYVIVRSAAEHGWTRRTLGVWLRALAGVGTGVALVAIQILPWVSMMSTVLVRGREQTPDQHIPTQVLLTSIAPYVFGTVQPPEGPYWYETRIFLEEVAYVGAGVAVLLIAAIALFRRARVALPRGAWWFFVVSTAVWGGIIFLGGPPLALLQKLPYLFSDNAVERARSVLGFGVAVIAAVGFQLLLDRARDHRPLSDKRRAVWGGAVWAGVAAFGVVLYVSARRFALVHDAEWGFPGGGPHLGWLNRELAIGLMFVCAALGAAGWLWFAPRHRALRLAAAALIPLLVAAQALLWVHNYWPRTPVKNFYPVTDTHRYLEANLGHERFWGSNGAVLGGVHQLHRLRGLQGHSFVEARFAELLEALPGYQFSPPPKPATFLWPQPLNDGTSPTNPILDRLSVAEYVTPATQIPYGVEKKDAGDASTYTLSPGRPVSVPVPVTGPIRGIGVTPVSRDVTETYARWIGVVLRDSSGREVARSERVDRAIAADQPFYVPLAAEDVPAGTRLTAEISLRGDAPLLVAGRSGAPALSTVARTNDGLTLVKDGDAIVYQRATALPRARWASSVVVERSSERRLGLLADGALAADAVVLDAPGGAAEGKPATVRWVDDGFDEMRLAVDAEGAGYLVLADAIQSTWRVTVDGRPADLVRADHGLAAVHVPAGTHTIDFSYAPKYAGLGAWLSAGTAILLVAAVTGEWWYLRRRRADRAEGGVPAKDEA